MCRNLWAAPALAVALSLLGAPARADIVYSNITNFSGFDYAAGGAADQSGNTITAMIADDITPVAGTAGEGVTSITFSVGNTGNTSVTARALVRFYASDGVGGGPGTLLAGLDFNPIAFTSGVGLFTYTPGTTIFTLPSGTFWAGITFDDNGGTTGATAAGLDNLGQGIFAPPTVGSSSDEFFQTTSAGSFSQSNPQGSFLFFGGNPAADFGWSFSTATVVAAPEPASLMLLGIGVAGIGLRARRRKATA